MGEGVPVTQVPTAVPTAAATLAPAVEATAVAVVDTAPTAEAATEPAAVNWWQDAVFYEVFVRSYFDSDADGIGDLQGLIERLDYLNDGDPATDEDLGVDALWLMPIMQSPSYHGYDVTDYFTVEEDYGTNEDFRELIDEAHARGMRVIIDLVLNHTSSEHPWFEAAVADPDAATRDYYIWSEDAPSYRGPWGQEVWHESPTGYYYGLFWGGMPDLNYRNPEVTAEMHEAARFWLEEMGADGFRLDAIKYLVENEPLLEGQPETHLWLEGFNEVYKSGDPETYAVGEVWSPTFQAVKYVGDELDAVFEFDLAEAMIGAINSRNAANLIRAQQTAVDRFPAGGFATFLANHDQNRVMNQLVGGEDKARLAAALLLTSPGTPFLYYGEEIGQSGAKPDEDIRLPLQWSDAEHAGFTTGTPWRAPAEDYPERNIALQTADPGSLLSVYRDLIDLRGQHSALHTGAWTAVEASDRAGYAFVRHDEAQTLLVVANLDDEPLIGLSLELTDGPLAGGETAVLLHTVNYAQPPGDPAVPAINSGGGFDGYSPWPELPPRSLAVIALQ